MTEIVCMECEAVISRDDSDGQHITCVDICKSCSRKSRKENSMTEKHHGKPAPSKPKPPKF